MRTRLLLASLFATTALLASSGGASAVELYTSSAHSATVPVGATASATITAGNGFRITSGTATVNNCSAGTLGMSVTQNSAGTVRLIVSAGTFSACVFGMTVTVSADTTIDISGIPFINGGVKVAVSSFTNVSLHFLGGNYTGNLTNVTATEPTAAGAPICFKLSNSGTLVGPLTSAGKVDAQYCLDGTAAAYSF
jgi:hypothetical protein